jgi:predicted amidophosphoribosyltransferase
MAFPAARRRFITPRIANPICPNCGSDLVATELYCENCKSVTKIPKEGAK